MAVAVIVAMATIQSTQASIDFWLDNTQSFAPGLNHITVCARNGGGMDGDFNLVLTFSNANFSKQTEMPYSSTNPSCVRLKFVLHKGDFANRTVYFETIDSTSDFSVGVTLEKTSYFEFLKANQLFPAKVSYSWNSALNVYNCTDAI